MFEKLIKSNNLRNSYWIIGEQIFQMVLGLIIGMWSARYLGPSNYGTLNYTASFVSFFISFATLGMDGVLLKKIVSNPDIEGEYLGSCFVFRIVASFLSSIAIAIIIIILNPTEPIKLVLALIQSLQLAFKAFYTFDIWFQRYLKSRYTSIAKMLSSMLIALYKLFLLVTAKDIIWFAVANSLPDCCIGLILLLFYKKSHGPRLSFRLKTGMSILSESYHFILSDLMSAVCQYLDRVMIGWMLSDEDVGYYIAASTISTMWTFVPSSIIKSFRPMIMELKVQGNDSLYRKRLTQLFSVIIWIGIVFSLGVFLFSNIIVDVLYGKDYSVTVGPLRVIVWASAVSIISSTRSVWIICENKNQFVKYYILIGAISNTVLNFLLIPKNGITGAAIATLITELTILIFAPLLFKETRSQIEYLFNGLFFRWK